jgi:hypothetical protein
MVLVDYSVWGDCFNGAPSLECDALEGLPTRDLVLIGDLILTEVLQEVFATAVALIAAKRREKEIRKAMACPREWERSAFVTIILIHEKIIDEGRGSVVGLDCGCLQAIASFSQFAGG